MPKVYLSEQERLNTRLAAWVYGQIKIQGISQTKIAKERGVSKQAISQKLRTKSFDFEDLCCFVRLFEPETDELRQLLGMKGVRE